MDGSTGFGAVVEIVLYCGLASIGVAIVWLLVLMMAGEFLIWLSLGLIIAFNAGTAFFLTKLLRDQGVEYFWWPAIVFGGVALLVLIYACVVRVGGMHCFRIFMISRNELNLQRCIYEWLVRRLSHFR